MRTPDAPDTDDLTRPATLLEDWQSVPESTDEWEPGQQLGPFRLRRQLGRGGMGMVWLADQLEPLRREVAIKVLPLGTRSRMAEAYFEVERQSLAQLSHHAGRLPDGGLFFAMEYVRAEPLDEFLSRNPLDFPAVAQLLIDICAGVQHAHQRGLIHRDLKPGNILVRADGGEVQPKIIDFGIAISTDGGAETERTRYSRAGTMAYMAPEQRDRESGGIDVRTDVYALGAVLGEALLILAGEGSASERRFVSTTVRDELLRSLPARGRDAELPRAVDPTASLDPDQLNSLPVELRAIAARAMAEDPDHRYPSAAAMAEDLRRWLDAEPVRALDGGRMYRLRCFLRRNAVATSAGALIGLSLIVGVVLALYGLGEARDGRAQAEQAQQLAEDRRDDAEGLIEFMLGDFSNGLRTIGRLDLLDRIGDEALQYLTEAGPADDAPSALNRARALRTLGEVHVRRAQFREAERALSQASALLQPWIEARGAELPMLYFESGQIAYWRGTRAYRERDWDEAEV
ncbi:MAG: serine/threonine-protein kinase, partial [Wenzhouxiangellaceae bacterium]